MVSEWLQKLLILQDRDLRCDSIQRQIEEIPFEISKEEKAIEALRETISEREGHLKALEVRRLELEGDVAEAQEQILKYKTQQMQVKKNEEYTALGNEITRLENRISDLEDTELQLMEQMEISQKEFDHEKQKAAEEQHTFEAHIELLKKNLASFEAELSDAQSAVKECEQPLDAQVLQQYRYVKSQVKRPPVVVAMSGGRCQGCHLKVSGEVESACRKGHELVRCDSCGRILYFDR